MYRKLSKNTPVYLSLAVLKSDTRFFARKRCTVTVNDISVFPSWFYCALNS